MQQNELTDDVCISVREKFNHLSLSPSERCIFRVHDRLRMVNKKAYEPNIIAIGPYHRGKENLLMMEEHKVRYLQLFLQRENESLLKYVVALRTIEGKIRKCYAEPLSYINANDFIEMMIFDGVFIVELMQKFANDNLRERNDPIFEMGWICWNLGRDLLLFENQIPFFVLNMLFSMIKVLNHDCTFSALALHFFGHQRPSLRNGLFSHFQDENTEHLLGLVHRKLLLKTKVENKKEKWRFIHCATELRESGIKFEKIEAGELFDIKFKNGIIQIPRLLIDDGTESFFRNLGAYEQYRNNIDFHLVSDYLTLMDCLVNSPKDVEILCRCEIIDNWQGDDEVVSTMFNKIGDSIIVPDNLNFCYAGIFNKINMHCSKRINRWMAKLRRNYLSTPWAIISVLAAFLLLVLTFLQTVFTMKS